MNTMENRLSYLAYLMKIRLWFYSYESDLGDGWEDEEVRENPNEIRLNALQMGVNIIYFALTHNMLSITEHLKRIRKEAVLNDLITGHFTLFY